METITTAVEKIMLSDELEKRVAVATVRIDDIRISGVTLWRGGNGRLRVYWPRYWNGASQAEAIELPSEVRSDAEAEVIAAYKEAKKAQKPEGGVK